ncbi:hypothetical protein AB833_27535 [Chromatiales bacterium (ex Bugula neritina AB1)]|nr:hypothetical protein AB833_27535 [Chromatiales bacterium (ex Bugula neritina AB1)]
MCLHRLFYNQRAAGLLLLLSISLVAATRCIADDLSTHSAPLQRDTPASLVDQGRLRDQAIHILGGNANVISRWIDEVRYVLVGHPRHIPVVNKTLVEISTLTQVPVRSVDLHSADLISNEIVFRQAGVNLLCEKNTGCANFVVVVADIAQMKEIASAAQLRRVYRRALDEENVLCFFAPFQSASIIRQALVFVRSDQSEAMLNTCLREEIYQSFGLFNDYTDSEFFSFNNSVEPKSITQYDRHLLRAVYKFKAGTPAFSVVQRFMRDLGPDQDLE